MTGGRRVLRYTVPVDDDWHRIGGGRVLMVNDRPQNPKFPGMGGRALSVWTDEPDGVDWTADRMVTVVGTGNPVPDDAGRCLGSVDCGQFVWHLFEQVDAEADYEA